MTAQTTSHPAPHKHRVSTKVLMFGACAAPIFWLGQLMLSVGVTTFVCYPGDHPVTVDSTSTLQSMLIIFDTVAIIVALTSGIVSYRSWRLTKDEKPGEHAYAMDKGDGRARFMSLWGMISSLWFFGAIIFTTIASVMGPLCTR